MADIPVQVLDAALESAQKEQQYTITKHDIELIAREENSRRLRSSVKKHQQNSNDLQDQLQEAQDGTARLKKLMDEHLARAQSAETMLEELQRETRCREHELHRLKSENQSLRDSSNDTSTVLAQKLALDRELSVLRPELEHLKAQSSAAERLQIEKLALQRELSEAQCGIEGLKIESARLNKRQNTEHTAIAAELEEVKEMLVLEKQARKDAEKSAAEAQADLQVNDVRQELADERATRQKLEIQLEIARTEGVQSKESMREMAEEKHTRQRLEKEVQKLKAQLKQAGHSKRSAETDEVVEDLRQQLQAEKNAHAAAVESAAEIEQRLRAEMAELAAIADRGNGRLRPQPMDSMTLTEEELARAIGIPLPKTAKSTRGKKVVGPVAKEAKSMQDETTLGTPGNGPTIKRRKPTAAIGDKSTFSMTPFLNKTSVLNVDDDDEDVVATPVQAKPLAPAASIKSNAQLKKKGGEKEKMQKKALSQVVEEETQQNSIDQAVLEPSLEQENMQEPLVDDESKSTSLSTSKDDSNTKSKENDKPASRRQKPRKSLTDFKSFQIDDEKPVIKSKKRKLGGRGPTLFDADDDDGTAPDILKSGVKSGLFGASAYARLASVKKGGAKTPGLARSGFGSTIDGSTMQFSPLKRHRKNLDDTLRG